MKYTLLLTLFHNTSASLLYVILLLLLFLFLFCFNAGKLLGNTQCLVLLVIAEHHYIRQGRTRVKKGSFVFYLDNFSHMLGEILSRPTQKWIPVYSMGFPSRKVPWGTHSGNATCEGVDYTVYYPVFIYHTVGSGKDKPFHIKPVLWLGIKHK